MALQPSGDSFFKRKINKNKKKEKRNREARGETSSFLTTRPLNSNFLIKNRNDKTRTAIAAHSLPLSPPHEQVTNKWMKSFNKRKAYNQIYHKKRKYKNNWICFIQKNVWGIKRIKKGDTACMKTKKKNPFKVQKQHWYLSKSWTKENITKK